MRSVLAFSLLTLTATAHAAHFEPHRLGVDGDVVAAPPPISTATASAISSSPIARACRPRPSASSPSSGTAAATSPRSPIWCCPSTRACAPSTSPTSTGAPARAAHRRARGRQRAFVHRPPRRLGADRAHARARRCSCAATRVSLPRLTLVHAIATPHSHELVVPLSAASASIGRARQELRRSGAARARAAQRDRGRAPRQLPRLHPRVQRHRRLPRGRDRRQ